MPEMLPRLRMDLDFMPSPVPDRPGLMIRDPFHYSDATLIVPPVLVECLQFFDGQHGELDLREALVRLTGDIRVGEVQSHLIGVLSQAGFFEDEVYAELRRQQHEAFEQAPLREPAHAGSAYPGAADELTAILTTKLGAIAPRPSRDHLVAIAAPHVSPEGGWAAYTAAYGALGPEYAERTFVVLGTSHYGEPERFGLTRKPFATPLGQARTDCELVDRLHREAGAAVTMEDYCHAVEHSIEFQVVFLQHLFGPEIRILPILCGPFAHSVWRGGRPEQDDAVRRFIGALADLHARESGRLLWVLGVDMAHIGRRYGDPYAAQARQGRMAEVEEQDRKRIAHLVSADAESFWAAVQENRDALKWCGSAPFYTFLRAVPEARGELLEYQQWNIDEQSVVTFAGMAFRA